MKLAALSLLSAASLVAAHGDHHHHARQLVAAVSSSAASPAAASPSGVPGGATVTTTISGVAFVTTYTLPPTASYSLQSTNPTAIPLSDIYAGAPSQSSISLFAALSTTYTAGSTPSAIPGAPPLPDISQLAPANYPALDVSPPTDSAEVQAWIQEVQNSGVPIPDFPPNQPGGCPANLAASSNATLCWWTCGGCSRDTDITTCPNPLTWGLTHDDGPSPWTPSLLQYLDEQNLHTTFFVVGSRAISRPDILQAEYMAGHQVAVHTWSHPPLTTLSTEAIIAEFGWSRKIIKDVTGVTPKMYRPPYGDVDDRVRAIATAMGLTTVIWTRISPMATFDTGDFYIASDGISPSQVLANFEAIMGNATVIPTGFIVLEHDLFQQTVDIATGYILPDALAHNPPFDIKPVINCLNLPMSDAYVETNNNQTYPPAQLGLAAPTTYSTTPTGAAASGGTPGASGTGSGPNSQSTGSDQGSSASSAARLSVLSSLTAVIGVFAGVVLL